MDCERAVSLISARLDGEISADDRAALEAHLSECPACRATAEAFAIQDQDVRRALVPCQQGVHATVAEVCGQLAPTTPAAPPQAGPAKPWLRWVVGLATLAAAVALVLVGRSWLTFPTRHGQGAGDPYVDSRREPPADHLKARDRSKAPDAKLLAVGTEVSTGPGERQRLLLPDGSVLFVNQKTKVHLDDKRKATVSAGSVFVEVSPREDRDAESTFVIHTPAREVSALGTKFAVEVSDAGTGVVVTQGKVRVSGIEDVVHAGQQLPAGSDHLTAAPRTSHVLDWTRELMASAESPLVPGSKHSGGSLVVVDPNGQEAKLELRRYHVDVHIEDGFARTTIDQTYFNQHPWRLEGTFHFPLPADASLSRLAMYVDGRLMEGGMTERDYGRSVYQKIVNSQKDPALLEWVDGTTFRMRVFPLEGWQEKRIVLSYTQRLPALYARTQYRFPAGHSLQLVRDWSFHALVKNGGDLMALSPTHPEMKVERKDGDLVLDAHGKVVKVDRDVTVDLIATGGQGSEPEAVRFARAELDGMHYMLVRYRPELAVQTQRQNRHWVFLVETSADRDPLLARAQIEIVRNLLGQAEHDDTFCVLAAGTYVRPFADEALTAVPENIDRAVRFLEGTQLIGALDLGRALGKAGSYLGLGKNPHLVHIGSGKTAIGQRQDTLAREIATGVRYVGIGVGKRWNRAFLKQCAERTGGYFAQINPDETIAWRTFDLLATLNTPRLMQVTVDSTGGESWLLDQNAISQGEEICALTRLGSAALPKTVTIKGTLEGQPFQRELAVADVRPNAGYVPRSWARLEIDRLVAKDPRKYHDDIVSLSKAMYVMSPFTSLLVLENEEMYAEFKVDRGRKDHWAMYPCPAKIEVVFEPDPLQPIDARNAPRDRKPSANEILQTVLVRGSPSFGRRSDFRSRSGSTRMMTLRSAGGRMDSDGDAIDSFALGVDGTVRVWEADDKAPERLGDFRTRVHDPLLLVDNSLSMIEPGLAGKMNLNSIYPARPMREIGGVVFSPDGAQRLTSGEGRELAELWDAERTRKKGGEHFFRLALNAGDVPSFDEPPVEYAPAALALSLPPDAKPEPNELPSPAFMDALWVNGTGRIRSRTEREQLLKLQSARAIDWALDFDPVTGASLGGVKKVQLRQGSVRLELPSFQYDEHLFRDLVSFAPGLNTQSADMQAILEEEAAPVLSSAPGKIDPAAAKLLDTARKAGWQRITFPEAKVRAEEKLFFNGAGQYAIERTLPLGLREQIVCDGKVLLHLYPELGLAARRTVSRFHRADLLATVPWLVAHAPDLARGADVVLVDDHTVGVVPHRRGEDAEKKEPRYLQLQLVFGADGQLAERQLVEMPARKVHLRQTFDGKGLVRWLNADGKEIDKVQYKVSPAASADLEPDLSALVVVPMPYRSLAHVMPKVGLFGGGSINEGENGCYRYLRGEKALWLLTTLAAEGRTDEARQIYRFCFHEAGDERIGFLPLLAACEVRVTAEPAFASWLRTHGKHPLVRYFALLEADRYQWAERHVPLNLGRAVAPSGHLLARLAEFRDLVLRFQGRPLFAGPVLRPLDRQRLKSFVERERHTVLSAALLTHVSSNATIHGAPGWLALSDLWKLLADTQESYLFRYEQAVCLVRAGEREEAREMFVRLYDKARKRGALPLVESYFRSCLQGDRDSQDCWAIKLQETARELIEKKQRAAVVVLAWQCRDLGDQPLADNLLALALEHFDSDGERLAVTLSAIEYLSRYNEAVRAARLLDELLTKAPFDRLPGLWRLASKLAEERGDRARSVEALEQALEREYPHLPEVINLEPWRNDHRKVLDHYLSLARTLQEAGRELPADLLARTVRQADRWRSHDPEPGAACDLAAQILQKIGTRELAWEYLTTSHANPSDHATLQGLAESLRREGKHELAERAYNTACDADPADALVFWHRAQNLIQGGRDQEAQAILKRLAKWNGDEADWIRTRAKWVLDQR
jgi:ferric-dicitrate binding protein FerR (iron transport regulator)